VSGKEDHSTSKSDSHSDSNDDKNSEKSDILSRNGNDEDDERLEEGTTKGGKGKESIAKSDLSGKSLNAEEHQKMRL
jgi:hypothetical protein